MAAEEIKRDFTLEASSYGLTLSYFQETIY